MRIKFRTLKKSEIGVELYAYKATKHFVISTQTQDNITVVQPGDYVVLDRFYNISACNRYQFKSYFGHRALQLMDEEE